MTDLLKRYVVKLAACSQEQVIEKIDVTDIHILCNRLPILCPLHATQLSCRSCEALLGVLGIRDNGQNNFRDKG